MWGGFIAVRILSKTETRSDLVLLFSCATTQGQKKKRPQFKLLQSLETFNWQVQHSLVTCPGGGRQGRHEWSQVRISYSSQQWGIPDKWNHVQFLIPMQVKPFYYAVFAYTLSVLSSKAAWKYQSSSRCHKQNIPSLLVLLSGTKISAQGLSTRLFFDPTVLLKHTWETLNVEELTPFLFGKGTVMASCSEEMPYHQALLTQDGVDLSHWAECLNEFPRKRKERQTEY